MEKKSVPQKVPFCPFPYPAAFLVVGCPNVLPDPTALKVLQNRSERRILCILFLDALKPLLGCRNP